ncbi:MAG: hypothetical protein AABW85_00795 [archaeon]
MDFKAIMKAILVPIIILSVLSLASVGISYYLYSSSATGGVDSIVSLVQLVVSFIGGILVLWGTYKVGKTTGSLAASAIGGIITELIPAILSGVLYLVLIVPFLSDAAGGGLLGSLAGTLGAGIGIIGLIISIVLSIISGTILGLIGGFFGKKKFSLPDKTMNQQFAQQNQGTQDPQVQPQPKMQQQWPPQQQQQQMQQQEYYREPPSPIQPFRQTTQQQPAQQFSSQPQQPAQKFVPKLEKLSGETGEQEEKNQFRGGYNQEEETKEQIMSRMRESQQEPPQPQLGQQQQERQEEMPSQEQQMAMQGEQEFAPKKLTRNQIEEFEQQFKQQPPAKKAPVMVARLTPEERDQATQLTQILADDKQNYSPDQVKKVILEKGYSEGVAQEVVRRLYQM